MDKHEKLEKLRVQFENLFNRQKLESLTLEEYAIDGRTHSQDCFCYWIEYA